MYKELVQAQREYIKLLDGELKEVSGLAISHGWKSSRYEKGVELREKIKRAEDNIKITAEMIHYHRSRIHDWTPIFKSIFRGIKNIFTYFKVVYR